ERRDGAGGEEVLTDPHKSRRRCKNGWVRRLMALAVAMQTAGCAALSSPKIEVPPGPRGLDAVSPEERARYIQAAQVWRPIDTASLDLHAGPPGDGAFAFEQAVTCDYAPAEQMDGHTPKFYCE